VSNLYYPTILGKIQCPECGNIQINSVSTIDYEEKSRKPALHPDSLNILFHCTNCGTIFVDYFSINIEKKRKKLFSLIGELDSEADLNNAING
jgi:uncharacterized Zn finger protein